MTLPLSHSYALHCEIEFSLHMHAMNLVSGEGEKKHKLTQDGTKINSQFLSTVKHQVCYEGSLYCMLHGDPARGACVATNTAYSDCY